MSKRTNTILFVLGGTAVNILITLLAFILLLVIYTRFFYSLFPESTAAWMIPVLFVVSIAISFFAYRLLIKIIMKKVDLEKYLDPIFGSRRLPPKR